VVTNFSKEPQKKEINVDEIWMWKRRTGVLLEKPALCCLTHYRSDMDLWD
jgi:hypothetical protein